MNLNRFLIINPFGIGDVLFTTPVIRAVKENYPQSFIGYWCNERVADILRDNPSIDRVFALSRGDLKKLMKRSRIEGWRRALGLYKGIRKERFDISLDFSLEHRYSLISKLSGIRERLGFDYKGRARFLTKSLKVAGRQDKHAVESYLGLLGLLDIRPKRAKLELFTQEEAKKNVEALLRESGVSAGERLIGIAPGAGGSWGKEALYKHWPAEKFSEVADKLRAETGCKVLILGDETERPIAEKVLKAANPGLIDLCGRTGLREFAAAIAGLKLLITNDGGPLHMAVALGVPTVSIFGPVDEQVYGPYPHSDKHIVIKEDIACRPCYRDLRFSGCSNNRLCLTKIEASDVYQAARRLIQ